ncbi:glucokinase, partial [Aeromonas jandaei]
ADLGNNAALSGSCEYCKRALDIFCAVLGSYGGNLALSMCAFGGVYVAGGIVPRFVNYLQEGDFRRAFENKGRFTEYVSQIPTYVITSEYPGLIGASVCLRQQFGYALETFES